MKKPTIEEIQAYFESIGVIDSTIGEKFFWHYEKIGWVTGKYQTPMKSWRGACHTWRLNMKRDNVTEQMKQIYATKGH